VPSRAYGHVSSLSTVTPPTFLIGNAHKHFLQTCCSKCCMASLSFEDVLDSHIWYHGLSQADSLEWLRTALVATRDDSGHSQLRFRGALICHRGYKLVYGFSNNKFSHALRLAEHPYMPYIHGNVANLNASNDQAHMLTHYWFMNFIQTNGDRDPASNNIHIPDYVSKELLYTLFIEEQKEEGLLVPKERSFQEYIRTHFPNVKFLKHTRLGRCTFCMDIAHKKHQVFEQKNIIFHVLTYEISSKHLRRQLISPRQFDSTTVTIRPSGPCTKLDAKLLNIVRMMFSA